MILSVLNTLKAAVKPYRRLKTDKMGWKFW